MNADPQPSRNGEISYITVPSASGARGVGISLPTRLAGQGSYWCLLLIIAFMTWSAPSALAAPFQLISAADSSLTPPIGGDGDSLGSILSADARFVVFASTAENLVATSKTNGGFPHNQNVYVRDRVYGTTLLVSADQTAQGGGNDLSSPVAISTNGQYVLFESSASNLIADDTNEVADIFVRNIQSATTSLVSISTNGSCGNGLSSSPVMTPDGRFVAFASAANNLVPDDTNGIPDIFVRDLMANITTLVSFGAMPTNSTSHVGNASAMPEITPDGRYVAFFSTATNLVPGVQTMGDIYVRDLVAGTTSLASTNARTIMKSVVNTTNVFCFNQIISDDGKYVAYQVGTNGAAQTPKAIVLRHDLQTGLTDIISTNGIRASVSPGDEERTMDMTPNGRFIAYMYQTNPIAPSFSTLLYVWDGQSNSNQLANVDENGVFGGGAESLVLDSSGRYIAFLSTSHLLTTNNFPANGTNKAHLYVRDLQLQKTTMLDTGGNGTANSVPVLSCSGFSADAAFIAFEALDGTLVTGDNNRAYDVFLCNVANDTRELISLRHPALASISANGLASFTSSSVSTNGRYIAFTSSANNLVPGDVNNSKDVFVHDLLSGTNLLVSQFINGLPGTNASMEAVLTPDGRFVGFSSLCNLTLLSPANYFYVSQVFVRDLQTGTTTLVSSKGTGINTIAGNGASYLVALSADGNYALFNSAAGNLFPSTTPALYFRDLRSTNLYRLTTGNSESAMTPDGRFVVYGAVPGVFVWNSQLQTNIYSQATSGSAFSVAITADGGRMAYAVSGAQLYAVDVVAGTNWVVHPGPFFARAGLKFSGDGNFLVYAGRDANGTNQVYLYDFLTKSNFLVSKSFNSDLGGSGNSDSPTISADNRFIAYRSRATNIVPADTKGWPNLFIYDRLAGSTTFLSFNQNGTGPGNSRSLNPIFSGDGQTLFFQSWASDLVNQDFNQYGDIFALHLTAPTLTDSDGDGMNDAWETQSFNTLDRDGTGDFDGDGATDLFEFQTGTNPADPNSYFHGQLIFSAAPTLLWTIAPGKAYRVQYKDSLSDTDWNDLNGTVTIAGGQATATDLVPATDHRFYRIVLIN